MNQKILQPRWGPKLRKLIYSITFVLAFRGFGHAQTQDWTGVPPPGNDPQLQQLYSQAMAQAQSSLQGAQSYMPSVSGVPQQYVQWGLNSATLFSAKWDYWQLLNPKASMLSNPQYLRDYAAFSQGCYPQCPNFPNSGNSNGGRPSNPTAPANTINPSLYGAAALSRGLVSPSAVAQQEADAEAADLMNEVAGYTPSSGSANQPQSNQPDDPLEYNGPRELDFNHPETLPDTMPGVSVIVFPGTATDSQIAPSCMTIATCTAPMPVLTEDNPPGSGSEVSTEPTVPAAATPGTPAAPQLATPEVQNEDTSTQVAFQSITSQINDQVNQNEDSAAQAGQERARENTEGLKDLATDAVVSALDPNGVSARLTTDFGTAASDLKAILSSDEDQTHPIEGIAGYLKDQISTNLLNKAYDTAQDALVDKATSGMDQGAKLNTVFDSVLAPSSFVSLTKLKDNFFKYYGPAMDSFFGVVREDSQGKEATEQ